MLRTSSGYIDWPPRSPDLRTPNLKEKPYLNKFRTFNQFKNAVKKSKKKITTEKWFCLRGAKGLPIYTLTYLISENRTILVC